MKIYLAAPWRHREVARTTAAELTKAGHTITEPWWNHRDVNGLPEHADELRNQAWHDIQGVLTADRFVLLDIELSEGKAWEQGLAWARKIPIIAVGEPGRSVFHFLPQYTWVRTIEELLEVLN